MAIGCASELAQRGLVFKMSARASPGVDQSIEPPKDGKDKYWDEMTEDEQNAARVLGWGEVRSYAGWPVWHI